MRVVPTIPEINSPGRENLCGSPKKGESKAIEGRGIQYRSVWKVWRSGKFKALKWAMVEDTDLTWSVWGCLSETTHAKGRTNSMSEIWGLISPLTYICSSGDGPRNPVVKKQIRVTCAVPSLSFKNLVMWWYQLQKILVLPFFFFFWLSFLLFACLEAWDCADSADCASLPRQVSRIRSPFSSWHLRPPLWLFPLHSGESPQGNAQ